MTDRNRSLVEHLAHKVRDAYLPKYSGPGKTGVCKCGCSWEDHHLMMVMNPEYAKQTNESYIPGECEAYGCNETGGMRFVGGEWVEHCGKYEDSGA